MIYLHTKTAVCLYIYNNLNVFVMFVGAPTKEEDYRNYCTVGSSLKCGWFLLFGYFLVFTSCNFILILICIIHDYFRAWVQYTFIKVCFIAQVYVHPSHV